MKKISFFAILLISCTPLFSRVRIPGFFGDNMVLQQNADVPFWGWSEPNATISISCSWSDEIYKAKADKNAKWKTSIKTPPAGGPYTITISESNTILLHFVMIGEVWLCSGQSNMEWTVGAGIDHKDLAIAGSNIPTLRQIRIPKAQAEYPQDDIIASWEVSSPETVNRFSAVAYFFAKELTEKLHVPVGIIHSSWGGSNIEAWMPKELIDQDKEFSTWKTYFPDTYQWPYIPASTYNAMIHPLIPYKLAGVLWYQGESNVSNPLLYRRLFPSMINSWRDQWHDPFPFYYVQLAPFSYGRPLQGAIVQEAQRLTLNAIANTGMACTTDVGNINDIHPKNKEDVGKRLAYWALNKTYHQDNAFSGPLYKSINKEGNKIRVNFDATNGGLEIKGNKPELYRIAGDNHQFVDAHVEIDGNSLLFSNDIITDPVAVRYAFSNTAEGNLYGRAGLPASPFRSDDWPIIYNDIQIKSVYDPAQQGFVVTMDGNGKIVYSLDGKEPGLTSNEYTGPILVKQSSSIIAKGIVDNLLSENSSSKEVYLNKATYRPLNFNTLPSNTKYQGNAASYTLINGVRGNANNPNDGEWQGWEGNDMEVVLNLGSSQRIKKITAEFLQNQNAWIFLPSQIEISGSINGSNYSSLFKVSNPVTNDRAVTAKSFTANSNTNARYIKVKATNLGICPAWSNGAGSKAWLLADEIQVE